MKAEINKLEKAIFNNKIKKVDYNDFIEFIMFFDEHINYFKKNAFNKLIDKVVYSNKKADFYYINSMVILVEVEK